MNEFRKQFEKETGMNRDSVVSILMRDGQTGQLNPEFIEEMQGYPIGWTELRD